MLTCESFTAIPTLSPEIVAGLHRVGDFYIDMHFTKNEIKPQIVNIEGEIYYRFMDFLYLPQPPASLSTEQVIAICDLRLEYMDHLVVSTLNERIVSEVVACARMSENLPVAPIQALDFGCGSGLSSILLQKYWPELSLIGVDISEKAVARSVKQHLDARLIKPGQRLPFKDAAFKFIFAIFVMHFNVDLATLVELRRILQPSGKFVFNVYQRDIDGVIAQLQDAGFGSFVQKEIAGTGKTHTIMSCSLPAPEEA